MKIYLDESGTPGDINKNIPFIFGGFYTFKDEEEINSDWEKFLSNNQIPFDKKSTYFPKSIWLPFAEFLLNDYYPIITYSYFTEEDKELIKQKCKEYNGIKQFRGKDTPEKITSADFVWNLFSAFSVMYAIIGYILRYRNPITQIYIQIDRFDTKKELRNFTEYSINNFISPEKLISYIRSDVNLLETEIFDKLFARCIQFNHSIKFNWNIKGVKELPGAICTLQRRCFENIYEATQAWDVLEIKFKKNNVLYKGFLENLTDQFRDLLKYLNWHNFLN